MRDDACMGVREGERINDRADRRELAERWRQLGEKLRRRSPAAFDKLVALLATSTVIDDDEDALDIDSVYQIH